MFLWEVARACVLPSDFVCMYLSKAVVRVNIGRGGRI